MKIAIFGNPYQRGRSDHVAHLMHALRYRDMGLSVHGEFHDYLQAELPEYASLPVLDESRVVELDLAVSVGGDGTLLRAAQRLLGADVPVLGVNTGHLGYLTTAGVAEAAAAIDEFVTGKCTIEMRSMLQAECSGIDEPLPLAINEVAILRHHTSSMITMETKVNGTPLTTYKGDGLVVCTPTGSTAYNMSAGGPILAPTTQCLALSPVSPHALTMRPIVVRDDAVIEINTRSRAKQVQVSIDGNSLLCPSGSTVRVSLSPHKLRLVLRPGHNFALTLRKKLLWGAT